MSLEQVVKELLPDHYNFKLVENGVQCFSVIGIKDESEWNKFLEKLSKSNQFIEIFHRTNTNHLNFIVYLKPLKIGEKILLGDKIYKIQVITQAETMCFSNNYGFQKDQLKPVENKDWDYEFIKK